MPKSGRQNSAKLSQLTAEHNTEAINAFDALPIDAAHLTAVFGSGETPTSALPNLLVEGIAADANAAVARVSVSNVFKRIPQHGHHAHPAHPAHPAQGDVKFTIERILLNEARNHGLDVAAYPCLWLARLTKLAILLTLPDEMLASMSGQSMVLDAPPPVNRNRSSVQSKRTIGKSTSRHTLTRATMSRQTLKVNKAMAPIDVEVDENKNAKKKASKAAESKKASAARNSYTVPGYSLHQAASEMGRPLRKGQKCFVFCHHLIGKDVVQVLVEELHVTLDLSVFIDFSLTQKNHETIIAGFGPAYEPTPSPVPPAKRIRLPKVTGPVADEETLELTPRSRDFITRASSSTVEPETRHAQIAALQSDIVHRMVEPLVTTAYNREFYDCFSASANFVAVPSTNKDSECSRQTFDDLIASLPAGCADVPMILHCILDQVDNEEKQSPSEALRANGRCLGIGGALDRAIDGVRVAEEVQRTLKTTLTENSVKMPTHPRATLHQDDFRRRLMGERRLRVFHPLQRRVEMLQRHPFAAPAFFEESYGGSGGGGDGQTSRGTLLGLLTGARSGDPEAPEDDQKRCSVYRGNVIDLAQRLNVAPADIDRVLKQLVFKTFDFGFLEKENHGCRSKIYYQNGRDGIAAVKNMTKDMTENVEAAKRLLQRNEIQTWLYHDASGFGSRVLSAAHALPLLSWTRAPDAGSSFLALLPLFRKGLIARDECEITTPTKCSFKRFRNVLLPTMERDWLDQVLQAVIEKNAENSCRNSTRLTNQDSRLVTDERYRKSGQSTGSKKSSLTTPKTSLPVKTCSSPTIIHSMPSSMCPSVPSVTAYDMDGKLLRLQANFQSGFPFGGVQTRVERTRFEGEKEFLTATLIDGNNDIVICLHGQVSVLPPINGSYCVSAKPKPKSVQKNHISRSYIGVVRPTAFNHPRHPQSSVHHSVHFATHADDDDEEEKEETEEEEEEEDSCKLIESSLTATFREGFVAATRNVEEMQIQENDPQIRNAVWLSFGDDLSVEALARSLAVSDVRAHLAQSEALTAAQRELRSKMQAEEEEERRRLLAQASLCEAAEGSPSSLTASSMRKEDSAESSSFFGSSYGTDASGGGSDALAEDDASITRRDSSGQKPVWMIRQSLSSSSSSSSSLCSSSSSSAPRAIAERNRTTYADGTTVVAFRNGAIVILEADGGAWCWVQVKYRQDLERLIPELVAISGKHLVEGVNQAETSAAAGPKAEGGPLPEIKPQHRNLSDNDAVHKDLEKVPNAAIGINYSAKKRGTDSSNGVANASTVQPSSPSEESAWSWLHVRACGEREASFRGQKVDLAPLKSFTRELHPDEYTEVDVGTRIDGVRVLSKENETVLSHFFGTTIVKTENPDEGSVEVVIRRPPYADVRILQKPFDWRCVDQLITLERLVDSNQCPTPFAAKDDVILGNQGSEPFVDINHSSGAALTIIGDKGFYTPTLQPGVNPHLDRRFFLDGSSPALVSHVDAEGNKFVIGANGKVKLSKKPPSFFHSCMKLSCDNLNFSCSVPVEKARSVFDKHKHCHPWRCLVRDSIDQPEQPEEPTLTEESAPFTDDDELAPWRPSHHLDGTDDPLGNMLLYGHAPKLFFVKDNDFFEAVFQTDYTRILAELKSRTAPKVTTKEVIAEGTAGVEGLVTIDPCGYSDDVRGAMEWDPFSWFGRLDLDKEFGFNIESRKDLLSSDLKRKYELAAFDYVQRSIAPEAYKVNFYVDNDSSFPKSPVDDQGTVRPSFGQPKARCTCYTQSADGTPSASHCWMCCPDPSRLRMNYWDQNLKKLVNKLRGFLNLDKKALWDIYKRPYQVTLDDKRWRRNIESMRSETLEEWRRLIRPDAKFECYFDADWIPEHLGESFLRMQYEQDVKQVAVDLVGDVLQQSITLLEGGSMKKSGDESEKKSNFKSKQAPQKQATPHLSETRIRGNLRDSYSKKPSAAPHEASTRGSLGSYVKFDNKLSRYSTTMHGAPSQSQFILPPFSSRTSIATDYGVKAEESKETIATGERFEVYPNMIVINARSNNVEKIVINLSNYTNTAARVSFALPFQDELVIGNHATLKITAPKKFFLSPGMVTTMTMKYEPQDVPLPRVGDLGVIKRQIFIKFQPVQRFKEDAAIFFGYMLIIKIAFKASANVMKEAAGVSVGYAVKMRLVPDDDDINDDDDDDEDYRQRLRRRWEEISSES